MNDVMKASYILTIYDACKRMALLETGLDKFLTQTNVNNKIILSSLNLGA